MLEQPEREKTNNASQNPPRRAGHDSLDWIDRVAANIRDLNPDYHDFVGEVARMIRAAAPSAAAPVGASLSEPAPAAPAPAGASLLQGVIDARCHCQKCRERTENLYRQVSGKCRNCGAGPFLILYRGGDPASAQDCPRCKASYKPVSAERPATDDEIPAAVGEALASSPTPPPFDFAAHLQRQRDFSERTFGPGARTAGVVDHIRKELKEIEADPTDASEWADVVILGLDGFWRAGYTPEQIIAALVAKQTRNEARTWPDWRTAPTDKAIEHDRTANPGKDRPHADTE